MRRLEKALGWLAIPNLAAILITLQALGFLFTLQNPAWYGQLALVPDAVRAGEYYRLVTFLALPVTQQPIFMFFSLWFLWFIVNTLEQEWGEFRTTLYVLVSILVTIVYSMAFSYPVGSVSHLQSTLFLAAAMLFPDYPVSFFFLFPMKMSWLAAISLIMTGVEFAQGGWLDRGHMLAMYSNFIFFFAPALAATAKRLFHKWRHRGRF